MWFYHLHLKRMQRFGRGNVLLSLFFFCPVPKKDVFTHIWGFTKFYCVVIRQALNSIGPSTGQMVFKSHKDVFVEVQMIKTTNKIIFNKGLDNQIAVQWFQSSGFFFSQEIMIWIQKYSVMSCFKFKKTISSVVSFTVTIMPCWCNGSWSEYKLEYVWSSFFCFFLPDD